MNDSAQRGQGVVSARRARTEAESEARTLFVLSEGPEDLCRVKHVIPVDDLVDVVGEQGGVQQERDDLEREEEAEGEEGVGDHLGEDELCVCRDGSGGE